MNDRLKTIHLEFSQRLLETRTNSNGSTSWEWMRPVVKMASITKTMLATLEEHTQCYRFNYLSIRGFEFLANQTISVEDFRELIHKDDQNYFDDILLDALSYVVDKPFDVLKNYSFAFEFRLRCSNGSYRRILFKSMLVELPERGGFTLMLLICPVSYVDVNKVFRAYHLVNNLTNKIVERSKGNGLTAKEVELLNMMYYTDSSKTIASDLGKSNKTVDTQRKTLYRKLGVAFQQQAVSYGCWLGVISY
jgi:Response regulator containing a CheY-like receiver domain and an HTH DNA-binding domain